MAKSKQSRKSKPEPALLRRLGQQTRPAKSLREYHGPALPSSVTFFEGQPDMRIDKGPAFDEMGLSARQAKRDKAIQKVQLYFNDRWKRGVWKGVHSTILSAAPRVGRCERIIYVWIKAGRLRVPGRS
jgi:hypothetical protein